DERIGCGIFEAHLARLRQDEDAFGDIAFGAYLGELALDGAEPLNIVSDLLDLGRLVGGQVDRSRCAGGAGYGDHGAQCRSSCETTEIPAEELHHDGFSLSVAGRLPPIRGRFCGTPYAPYCTEIPFLRIGLSENRDGRFNPATGFSGR